MWIVKNHPVYILTPGMGGSPFVLPEKDKRTAPNTRCYYIYINSWYGGQSFCPFPEGLHSENVIDPLLQELDFLMILRIGWSFLKRTTGQKDYPFVLSKKDKKLKASCNSPFQKDILLFDSSSSPSIFQKDS